MKKINRISLIILVACLSNPANAQTQLTEEQIHAFKKVKSILVEVKEKYYKPVSVPFKVIADKYLRAAALQPSGKGSSTFDARLIIDAVGEAIATDYMGTIYGTHYTNAVVNVSISFFASEDVEYRLFFKANNRAFKMISKEYSKPADAPFPLDEVISEFHLQMARMVIEIYGSGALNALLLSPDLTIHKSAIKASHFVDSAWYKTGPAVKMVPEFIALVNGKDGEYKKWAVEALGMIGDRRVVPLLISKLQENGYQSVPEAEALGRIGDPRAVEPLIEALKNQYVKLTAAEALGRISDARAVEPLKKMYYSGDDNAKLSAIQALGKITDREAAKVLIYFYLNDIDKANKTAAANGLCRMGETALEQLIPLILSSNRSVREDISDLLSKFKPEWYKSEAAKRALPELIEALNNKDWYVCNEAAMALGNIPDTRSVEPLINALKAGKVRTASAEALGKLGDLRAVDPLIDVVSDVNLSSSERDNAAEALGRLGDKRAVEPLISVLDPRSISIVESASLKALRLLVDNQNAGLLYKLLNYNSYRIKIETVKILGNVGDKNAIEHLAVLLVNKYKELQDASKESLEKIDTGWYRTEAARKALPRITNALKDTAYYIRRSAIINIEKIDPDWFKKADAKAFLPSFTQALQSDDDQFKHDAIELLGKTGDVSAVKPLIAFLNDEKHNSTEMREYAASSLEKITGQNFGLDAKKYQSWLKKNGKG